MYYSILFCIILYCTIIYQAQCPISLKLNYEQGLPVNTDVTWKDPLFYRRQDWGEEKLVLMKAKDWL